MKFTFILLLLILNSCTPDKRSESCDELSMQKFRGVPMASKRFEENCREAHIRYTADVCQAALADLMHTHSLKEVMIKFGHPVKDCFTEADLKRFDKNN